MIKVIGVGDNVVDCYIHQNTMYPGGNCVNIAAFSRQLGHQSAYLGVLADDRQADVLRRALTDMGVDFSMCPTMHGETGRCSTNLVEGDRVIGDDNDLGLCKSNPLQITDEMLEYIKGFDVVHSSCYSFIEDQLCKIKSTGVPIVYDFSDGWEEKDFERSSRARSSRTRKSRAISKSVSTSSAAAWRCAPSASGAPLSTTATSSSSSPPITSRVRSPTPWARATAS